MEGLTSDLKPLISPSRGPDLWPCKCGPSCGFPPRLASPDGASSPAPSRSSDPQSSESNGRGATLSCHLSRAPKLPSSKTPRHHKTHGSAVCVCLAEDTLLVRPRTCPHVSPRRPARPPHVRLKTQMVLGLRILSFRDLKPKFSSRKRVRAAAVPCSCRGDVAAECGRSWGAEGPEAPVPAPTLWGR